MLSDLIWEVYSDKGKDYDEEQFFIDVEDYEKINGIKEISKLLKLGDNDRAAYKVWEYFLFTDYVSPLFDFQHVKDLNTEQKAKVLDEISDFWDFISNFKWCSKPMKTVKIINDEVKEDLVYCFGEDLPRDFEKKMKLILDAGRIKLWIVR